MSTYSNRLKPALQNLLQRVVWFFHPISSCTTTHISADFQRITLNTSCEEPNNSIYSAASLALRFSQFHSCGTYSVLSRSHSIGVTLLTNHTSRAVCLSCWLAKTTSSQPDDWQMSASAGTGNTSADRKFGPRRPKERFVSRKLCCKLPIFLLA